MGCVFCNIIDHIDSVEAHYFDLCSKSFSLPPPALLHSFTKKKKKEYLQKSSLEILSNPGFWIPFDSEDHDPTRSNHLRYLHDRAVEFTETGGRRRCKLPLVGLNFSKHRELFNWEPDFLYR